MFLQLKNIQVKFSINRVTKVKGFNNKLPENKFFPVWDFDDSNLISVITNLSQTQTQYGLPNIYITESSLEHFHAICFQSMGWKKCCQIMLDTIGLDKMFMSLTLARGFATLRMTQRNKTSFKPHLVHVLYSAAFDEINEIKPLIKGVNYDTRTT